MLSLQLSMFLPYEPVAVVSDIHPGDEHVSRELNMTSDRKVFAVVSQKWKQVSMCKNGVFCILCVIQKFKKSELHVKMCMTLKDVIQTTEYMAILSRPYVIFHL